MHIRITRTVVTLCLIIAMMIQPMLAFGASAPRVNEDCVQESLMCIGCGCCEINQVGDRCCCCGGAEATNSGANSEAGEPESNEPSIRAVVCEDNLIHGTCTCAISSQPMNNDAHRSVLGRALALRVLLVQYLTVAELKPLVARSKVVDSTCGRCADFSQRVLCVWRI